jgi:hypothetical protein
MNSCKPEWLPLSGAKRDGTPYLLRFKAVLPVHGEDYDIETAKKLGFKNGIIAVMMNRHHRDGNPDHNWPSGWQFAARVGVGGFPDDWFEGFMELPE